MSILSAVCRLRVVAGLPGPRLRRMLLAELMGRRMFSGGSGPWEHDPVADDCWGDTPPFHSPVLVFTSHAR